MPQGRPPLGPPPQRPVEDLHHRQAVVVRADRDLAVVRVDGLVEGVLGGHLEIGAHPDLLPVRDHQLDDRCTLHLARGDHFDGQHIAVGPQPPLAVAVPAQTHLVQEPVRFIEVAGRVRGGPFFLVVRHGRRHRVLARHGFAEVDRVVDVVAVYGQRQGPAEANVRQDLGQHRIGAIRQVGPDGRFGRVRARGEADLVLALRLLLQEQRVVLERQLAIVPVHVAGDDLEPHGLRILQHRRDHRVDVGELIALRIDVVVVGIPLPDHGAGRRVLVSPRAGRRDLEVQIVRELLAGPPRVPDQTADQQGPAIEPVLLGQLVRVLVVVDVVLLDGLPVEQPGAPGSVEGEVHVPERRGEAELDRMVIDLVHGHGLARDGEVAHELLDVVVLGDVLPPEQPVVRRVLGAVGEPQALSQREGQRLSVACVLEVLYDPGLQIGGSAVPLDRAVMDDRAERSTLGVALDEPQGPVAVRADRVVRLLHERFGGQPLLDGRQLSCGYHRAQHRRLVERRDRVSRLALVLGKRGPLLRITERRPDIHGRHLLGESARAGEYGQSDHQSEHAKRSSKHPCLLASHGYSGQRAPIPSHRQAGAPPCRPPPPGRPANGIRYGSIPSGG